MAGGSWEPHLDLEMSLSHNKKQMKEQSTSRPRLGTCLHLQKAIPWAPDDLCRLKYKPWEKYWCLQYSLWIKSPKSIQSPTLGVEVDALGLGSFSKARWAKWVRRPSPGISLSFPLVFLNLHSAAFSNNSSNCPGFRKRRWPPEHFRNIYFL